ncbi:MAG: hypothetical protein ACEQR8_01820 [Cypionkella sp.]
MRLVLLLPAALAAAGCAVENDPANDRVLVQYDEQRIEKAADTTGRAAKAVATGAANVAADTARAVKREVGDVDVDVRVTRKREEAQAEERARQQ